MLIFSLVSLLLSNSFTLRRDKSILYSRVTMSILIIATLITNDNLYFLFLNKGIGVFGGLFNASATTSSYHIFILLVTSFILLLTSFYPRKIWLEEKSALGKLVNTNLFYYQTILLIKMGEQYKIIEYSLIILFIIIGSMFLISTSDLVSIFLSIELQSYGLYLLSTIYRDSEPATSKGLMYFLLGGLSSCFILLSTSLLYANSGTTNLDNLYIITNISSVSQHNLTSLLYWYKSHYIHASLLFMSVGFLFKVAAAPFHFWSPDVYDAIPTIVTTFVAIIAKISVFIFLLELVHYTSKSMVDVNFSWQISLLYSSLLSLIIGTILGLSQSRLKRLYAFSTVSHVGFILLGLTIHTVESTQAFMFYLIQYSISNLNAFIIIIAIGYYLYSYTYKENTLEKKFSMNNNNSDLNSSLNSDSELDSTSDSSLIPNSGSSFDSSLEASLESNKGNGLETNENKHNLQDINNSPIQLIDQLKGYCEINPMLALSLAITLFSFAGIPPLLGFFGKQIILSAAIDNGYIFMSLVAILTSVISAVYYLAVIKKMYFDKANHIFNYQLENFNVDILLTEKDFNAKEINISNSNIVLSGSLSLAISTITLIITLFIFIPVVPLNFAKLLALILLHTL